MKQALKCLALFLVAVVLCTSSSRADAARVATEYRYAYAHHDCAPWDGPAWRIVVRTQPVPANTGDKLPKASFPFYSVSLWTGHPAVGTYIEIPGTDMKQGSIGEWWGENDYKPHTGRVRLTKITSDRIEGELRIAPADNKGRELVIPFSAPILPVRMLCG
jgi:hypothetical protein